ncbi:hypothetical protein QEH59_01470 [Coraliomargarita sp. SDUM461004]|uniref:GCVT N-terminal domain-containing protein n=1 Tax=Thalassobacterium sedimentorum TaxID=3041258 RepID=A0ABU1AE77_9BACT|nr:hypothetical protein [Coraliomargarita sp. SDUM461004]MDQ8193076.1 hypothetical protein [Coraliomargarita sp. SDUM461004]
MYGSKSFYLYSPAAHLLVTDEDAADFLQSQFTNDLRPFDTGQCCYGLWLDVKGKVIADGVVLCEGPERFRVLSERCEGADISAHLERHIIADEVELEPCVNTVGLELSVDGLDVLGMPIPESGRFISLSQGVLYGLPGGRYHIVVPAEDTRKLLTQSLLEAGFSAISEDARGIARIRAGVPQVPQEIGASDLPGEGNLTGHAVSFTKGCYLGQEVVARMHNLGQPQRALFVVQGTGVRPSLPVALYNSEFKRVGELRSAFREAGGWCGVAILKIRFVGVGEILTLGSNSVSVVSLLAEGGEND